MLQHMSVQNHPKIDNGIRTRLTAHVKKEFETSLIISIPIWVGCYVSYINFLTYTQKKQKTKKKKKKKTLKRSKYYIYIYIYIFFCRKHI